MRAARISCGANSFCVAVVFMLCSVLAFGQTDSGTVSGRVLDPAGRTVSGAKVRLIDIDRGTTEESATNNAGLYTFRAVHPGRYRMEVEAPGFKLVNITGLTVNTQANLEQNFALSIGSVSESITVEAKANDISTSINTVVDRQLVENLPLNGRSFQSLIELTPGVNLTVSNAQDAGQFSVNGQRASSNYWMVDGVSANIGIGTSATSGANNGLGGALGSFSALGGTNSLVSVDAMQEFRIQTSSYAPEFGRTPGAQISIATRPGTNHFHGSAFNYLRNDALDANNWFNGFTNNPPLAKPKERQNDFGGTIGGPIFKDHTFFFFSYEGLRLRLPQTLLTEVPDVSARQSGIPAMRPFLNAFPLPNGTDNTLTGVADFNASFSNPASLDAYSLRLDHKATSAISVFGRYNYSPSAVTQRGNSGLSLSTVPTTRITVQTATAGLTWEISPRILDEFRFNFSRVTANLEYLLDTFGGATPPGTLPLPASIAAQNSFFGLTLLSVNSGVLEAGTAGTNIQHQFNLSNSISIQQGAHNLKAGVDVRRLSPTNGHESYGQTAFFSNVLNASNGKLSFGQVFSPTNPTFLFRNLGSYLQDTWQVKQRLTLTYGLRWDIDFTPGSLEGPGFPAVTGFNLQDLSGVRLADVGTPPYETTYGNVAPRLGVAYQLFKAAKWQTVLRGGAGVFYDLASSEAGNTISIGAYPFGRSILLTGGTFPDPTRFAPLVISPAQLPSGGMFAFDPHLKLPYTLQWNVALEQALGNDQTLSVAYIGATGRRLIQTAVVNAPNPNFGSLDIVTNAGSSDYDALQVQVQRHLAHGLQLLSSYTWAHSLDTGSAGSIGVSGNVLTLEAIAGSNRADSDFDIRHSFSAGINYALPTPWSSTIVRTTLGGWSLQSFVLARSAPPVNIIDGLLTQRLAGSGFQTGVRPDLVPGQPLYLFGPQYPRGKSFNPAAFTDPPLNAGIPTRQGDTPRNLLRGFGAAQWDCAITRDFLLREPLRLQFRAEMFNVLNHPNFGSPQSTFGLPGFGTANQLLGQSLSRGNIGGGGFSPIYQVGGPRTAQLALRLQF